MNHLLFVPRNPSHERPERPALALSAVMMLVVAFSLATLPPVSARADRADSWVDIGFINQFDTNLDDDGNFDVRGGYGRGQFAIRLTEDVRIRTVGSYYGVSYEFDDPPTIAGSEFKPWNTVHVGRLNPLVDVRINERWRVFAGPLFELSFENGADLGNGFKPGGLIGAELRVSPELRVGFGLLGVAEIEDDVYLQPLLLLDWTPSEKIRIHLESWTTRGGKIEIAYRATDKIEIATSLRYRRERFRLKERTISTSPPPPVFRTGSKGIGEDRAVIPAARISYSPHLPFILDTLGAVRVDLEVGVALAGDLRIENRMGSRIQSIKYDPAPSLGLTITIPL